MLNLRNATITAPEFDKAALRHRGAVYGEDGLLVESALRKPDTLWRPGDPTGLPPGRLAAGRMDYEMGRSDSKLLSSAACPSAMSGMN